MIYRHRFQVRATLQQVEAFHSRSASMPAITPPPIIVRLHRAPDILKEGDQVDFTMWMGPLPVGWLARIEAVSSDGFTDRQTRGPFAEWAHRHTFVAVDEQTTAVHDEITLRLRPHLFWGPFGIGMLLGLPILFAYRQWKTKQLLQNPASHSTYR